MIGLRPFSEINIEMAILYKMNTKQPIDGCTISKMTITKADLAQNVYEGIVDCIDHIEHDIKSRDEWIARPSKTKIQKVFGKNYGLYVRPKEKNCLTGKYNFGLVSEVNKAIEHYIIHGILKFNPKLPSMKQR